MNTLKVGVNIVSCLRLGLSGIFRGTLFDPQAAIKLALEAGMDFLQILPLRGMTQSLPSGIPCTFCEGAWNAGTFLTWLTRTKGIAGSPMNLHDCVLFPSPDKCEALTDFWTKAGSKLIQHELGGDLIELYPGLNKTPEELLKLLLGSNQRLVVDAFQLLRNYRPDEIVADPRRIAGTSPLGVDALERFEIMQILAPVFAPVFHLNLREPQSPSIPPYYVLREWLRLTNQYDERWIVIEAESNLRWPRQETIDSLAFAKEATLNIFSTVQAANSKY